MKFFTISLIPLLLLVAACDKVEAPVKKQEKTESTQKIEAPVVVATIPAAKSEAEKEAEKAAKLAAEKAAKEAAEAKEAARVAAEKAEKEAAEAKADREKAQQRQDAVDKERYEREEKLRIERKADEDAKRKEMVTRSFTLVYADAEEVAEKFNEAWNGDFGAAWKVVKVAQAFPASNTIMITAPLAVVEECAETIAKIDMPPQQVYIEARFVELSNNASHKLGIDWQMLDGMQGSLKLDAGINERKMKGVSQYDSKDGSYVIKNDVKDNGNNKANLSYVNGTIGMDKLYVTLRALESSEDARVFSNPKIIVSSGKKATVDMTTKYPNVQIAAKKTINNNNESVDLDMKMAAIPGEDKMMFAKEAFFSWGISLDVTPRIGTNDIISVQIVPTISDLEDFVSAGTSAEGKSADSYSAKYPIIKVQRLVTDFEMKSGTTAVIGGLSRTVESQKDNGIPFLRDIWWIGPRLFGSKVRVKEQKEIIVFVTVGIATPEDIKKDIGLPLNAVLGRQYTTGIRREPGERTRLRAEGMQSLDLRSLEEQYADPRRTNRIHRILSEENMPFTKDPNYGKDKADQAEKKESAQ